MEERIEMVRAGREKFGRAGKPGKSESPSSWSDEKILHEVSDVATAPGATHGLHGTTRYVEGTRDGIEIMVEFFPDNHPRYPGRISTAYPTNTPQNPR